MDLGEKFYVARRMVNCFSEDLLQEGSPIIIQRGFEYLAEVMVLFAKQSNLFESILVLLENNHNEEALILNRSLLNNAFLIHYLHNKDSGNRFKEYKIQPIKANVKRFKKYKEMLNKGFFQNVEFIPLTINGIEGKIQELENIIIGAGFINKEGGAKLDLLNVSKMAEEDPVLYSAYAHYYDIGSRYEHSDSISLGIYKKKLDDLPIEGAFMMDLSRTDIELGQEVLDSSLNLYALTFMRIVEHIENDCQELFESLIEKHLGRSILIAQDYLLMLENQR